MATESSMLPPSTRISSARAAPRRIASRVCAIDSCSFSIGTITDRDGTCIRESAAALIDQGSAAPASTDFADDPCIAISTLEMFKNLINFAARNDCDHPNTVVESSAHFAAIQTSQALDEIENGLDRPRTTHYDCTGPVRHDPRNILYHAAASDIR